MSTKSVLSDAREVQLAVSLIELGARLQFMEANVGLSRERLIRLYKELRGVSPPKGLLPYSTDWYMTWLANIHSSMFYGMYQFMKKHSDEEQIHVLIKSYRLYLEQVESQGGEAVLDFTRAQMMVRFFDSDLLHQCTCTRCAGRFVTHAYDTRHDYVCVLCRPPSRAGKAKLNKTPAASDSQSMYPTAATYLLDPAGDPHGLH